MYLTFHIFPANKKTTGNKIIYRVEVSLVFYPESQRE